MQLDIFENSREVMLRNDAAHALERRDADGALEACERLAQEYPADEALPALRVLAGYIEATEADRQVALRDHESLREARQTLQEIIRFAAQRTFGEPAAAVWVAARWQDLARRAGTLAFDARYPHDHAAALWLRAGDWENAAQAVESIESWRRIPVPLAWMAEARLKLLGLRPSWPLLAELGWLSPALLGEVAQRAADPLLTQLMRSFEANFDAASTDGGEAGDLSWFAAWVLTERSDLREALALAQASQHSAPEQATRLMVELLGLERQGRHSDIVARRKVLRDLQPALYAAYMKRR
ncbi:hypothetical protein QTH97_26305 [Variovorax sp. J22R24]|uniref:hypothetical protein n=1 Tax=Variovorax gracilis TaxID=3053502 RepID=UPI002577E914|nr:hypothetical protein [Variovorax sp. J22R24]MDM0108489.1 hypothetical protein [Variovorax sp. J22R24]